MSAAIQATKAIQALQTLPVCTAILDKKGRIVAVNKTWKDFGRRNRLRMSGSGVGASYLQYCSTNEPDTSRFARNLRDLLAGRLDLLTFIYRCDSPHRKRWFCLIGVPLALDQTAGVALLHVNFTDMLPIAARPLRLKADRSGSADKMTGLGAISGAVKRSVSETLSAQLEAMLAGARASPPQRFSSDREAEEILIRARLSRRQVEILRLLGKGKSNKEIADLVFRSPHTVKLHVSAILRRLKLKSRTQAALLASRLNEHNSLAPSGA